MPYVLALVDLLLGKPECITGSQYSHPATLAVHSAHRVAVLSDKAGFLTHSR
ncbi:Uncharacterised protein [Vibrio cholerae]|nr:Uncharacterised protein [Vibrio cholerae]CSI34109.1 Uncharacterised protein [Vibrio cholerae]